MTDQIKNLAPQIQDAIKPAKHILLHCHPYPDPDSIGSVLAMAQILKKLGKRVTPIIGDSTYPDNLLSLPHSDRIQPLKYAEVDLNQFDLFVILDSSSLGQISRLTEVTFPEHLKTVIIDHHKTNTGYADVNLVEPRYSSTSQIIFDLCQLWGVAIDSDTAACLFMGIYADTGGFKYQGTDAETLKTASELAKICPDYHRYIFEFENTRKAVELTMEGLALSSIETYFSGRVAISAIPYSEIKKRNVSKDDAMEGLIGNMIKAVVGWDLAVSMVEAEAGLTTISFRTRDEKTFDVSKIAMAVGQKGGGHPGAAGTSTRLPLDDAKKELLAKIEIVYPQLKVSR